MRSKPLRSSCRRCRIRNHPQPFEQCYRLVGLRVGKVQIRDVRPSWTLIGVDQLPDYKKWKMVLVVAAVKTGSKRLAKNQRYRGETVVPLA